MRMPNKGMQKHGKSIQTHQVADSSVAFMYKEPSAHEDGPDHGVNISYNLHREARLPSQFPTPILCEIAQTWRTVKKTLKKQNPASGLTCPRPRPPWTHVPPAEPAPDAGASEPNGPAVLREHPSTQLASRTAHADA